MGYATLQIIPSVRGIGNELRRQLVGPAGGAGDDAGQAAGGGFADAFKGTPAAIGVTEIASKIGEQFTEAFTSALEQGSVTKTLANQLGSSGATASKQGAAVGRLFARGVTENFEQGAEAIRAVVSGGLVPPDSTVKQLDVIGTKMTDVANSFGTDMTLQSQAVSALLKNKLAPDATTALDLITVGFQKLGPNAEDLLDTLQEYPVQLRKLGLDAQTSLGLFQQGLQGGARNTDIIADAFKEFSIRAIDMSTTSQDAYKMLGLSASDMSAQIAKGGDSASAGLQTVLDRLRGITDPVKQNAAAVGLFGTQAEDLGSALFALDPSKASAALGDVTGAADKLGETFRSGPGYEIKIFTRAVKQGLVDFIGGQVLPILSEWGTIGWFREWGIWLLPLAVLIGGVTLALSAQAITTGITIGVTTAYSLASRGIAAVTRGWAAAQALLNGVMALNPFVLIAIAVVALGVALVIAYKKSETFRNIVTGAWEGIKTAAAAAWTGFIKPAADGFMTGLRAIGDAASWLWNTVLSPVFGFIGTAAKVLFTAVVVVMLLPIIAAFKLLAAVGSWLWETVLSPVFGWIGDKAVWLWESALKPAFGSIVTQIRTLGAIASWLWKNIFQPVLGWIADKAVWLWQEKIKPVWDLFKIGIGLLEVRGAGGHGAVMAMRKWAAAGGSGDSPGFAKGGGLFDWVSGSRRRTGTSRRSSTSRGRGWCCRTTATPRPPLRMYLRCGRSASCARTRAAPHPSPCGPPTRNGRSAASEPPMTTRRRSASRSSTPPPRSTRTGPPARHPRSPSPRPHQSRGPTMCGSRAWTSQDCRRWSRSDRGQT
ncbi:phage tail tape measure protein [Streptomyces sp. NBC_01591]|uniref:phage tail tape measure protein n=1 Tax=Streptomyces sp. NBC_01591 TaxID=2975888 RepID=UPI002DD953F3|nr:phage tail tape measure protein [Streptomyces sp. NBC_01591]WSD67143.1 phage tail tape measure protein [Streptomyces sp. NBC_01591]